MVYEESQKKFTWFLKQVEEEVGKYLKTQDMVDSTVFMDESFDNLWQYSNCSTSRPSFQLWWARRSRFMPC